MPIYIYIILGVFRIILSTIPSLFVLNLAICILLGRSFWKNKSTMSLAFAAISIAMRDYEYHTLLELTCVFSP